MTGKLSFAAFGRGLVCLSILVAGLTAGVALAASPSDTQYTNPGTTESTNPVNAVANNSGGTDDVSGAGDVAGEVATLPTLPFTGLSLVFALALCALLVAAGLTLRSIGRKRSVEQ
jgi:hypothetical protein